MPFRSSSVSRAGSRICMTKEGYQLKITIAISILRPLLFGLPRVPSHYSVCYCGPMPNAVAQPDLTGLDLESMAADDVAMAMKAGASDAEAVVREGDEFSVTVRMGQVEKLQESGSRGLGVRVFLG